MSHPSRIYWSSIFSLSSILYTVLGVGAAVIALKGFMIPNHFLDGGVTGISILVAELFHINISILLIVFNIPFVWVAWFKVGKTFAVQSALAILLLSIGMLLIQVPAVTNDKVLIAVFGGLFIGLSIGLVFKAHAMLDGLEIIADFTKKRSGLASSEIILVFNSFLFLMAAIGFGIETAMYSILVYFTAMKTADYVIDGFEQYTALTIISAEHEAVKSLLVNEFGKAISVYKGERGYLPGSFDVHHDCDFVMTIVTRLEAHKIQEAIHEIDPSAFLYVQTIKEVKGGLVKKLRPH